MNWLLLFLAGLLEVVWATGLKYSHGFTKLTPSLVTIVAMVAGFYLLSLSMRGLPLGTAYAVWVGIGAVGAAITGIFLFQEAVTPLKLVSLVLIILGVLGLSVASSG